MIFFDESQKEWYSNQFKAFLICVSSTEKEHKEHGTLAEFLIKLQKACSEPDFNEIHGFNDQQFFNTLFNGYTYTKRDLHSSKPFNVRRKIDKKMRSLTETFRNVS